jgi:hypothetical protein
MASHETYGYKAGWKKKVVVPIITAAAIGTMVTVGIVADRYFSRNENNTGNNAGEIGTPTSSQAAGSPDNGRLVEAAGIPVPEGTILKAGKPAIVREIDWTSNTVYLWSTKKTDRDLKVGRGYDGNKSHDCAIWTSESAWPWMEQDMEGEATRVANGSLGTNMKVNVPDGKGGFKAFGSK